MLRGWNAKSRFVRERTRGSRSRSKVRLKSSVLRIATTKVRSNPPVHRYQALFAKARFIRPFPALSTKPRTIEA